MPNPMIQCAMCGKRERRTRAEEMLWARKGGGVFQCPACVMIARGKQQAASKPAQRPTTVSMSEMANYPLMTWDDTPSPEYDWKQELRQRAYAIELEQRAQLEKRRAEEWIGRKVFRADPGGNKPRTPEEIAAERSRAFIEDGELYPVFTRVRPEPMFSTDVQKMIANKMNAATEEMFRARQVFKGGSEMLEPFFYLESTAGGRTAKKAPKPTVEQVKRPIRKIRHDY